jgi:predicted MFS family arabinose efflux permease
VLLGAFLIGLFGVRTLLGAFAEVLGWRTVLVGAAILVAACIPLTLGFAPRTAPPGSTNYLRILGSIPRIIARSGTLRILTLTHALAFSAFISVWSMITIFGVTRLGLSVAQTAAIGVAGLLGGATTIASARLQSRLGPRPAMLTSLLALVVGCAAIALFPQLIVVLVAGLFLVSFGMSSAQVSSQAHALASVDPAESGRANTVFMGTTFFASAIATSVAAAVMHSYGYAGVGVLALVLAAASATLGLIASRHWSRPRVR